MRKLFFSLFLVLGIIINNTGLGSETYRDLRSIRKVYLDVLGVPPTPTEVEWLCVYEDDSYKAAVDYILNLKYGADSFSYKEELKKNLHLISYRHGKYEIIPQWQLDLILKYQAGNVLMDKQLAKSILIKNALQVADSGEDPVDYLFVCLCGRPTNLNESNYFNKVYKSYSCETEGLNKILEDILLCHSYMFK